MDFSAIILFVLAVIAQTESVYRASDFAIQRNCTEIFSITTPKYVPYEENYRTRNWLGFTKWKTRINYRIENHVSYQRRSICCDGYTTYSSSLCIPLCSKSCGSYGVCSEPEICKCFQGYSMDHSVNECRPVCSNECVNGKCIAPDTCSCNEGFHKLPDGYTCEPICVNCSSLEYCVEPHICRCHANYHRSSLDRLDWSPGSPCEPICEKPCLNADCVEPNVCKCHEGYDALEDDVFSCKPRCSRGCGVDGYCSAPETCTCKPGYELSQPGSNVCKPVCTDECVNADCVAPDRCSCKDGYDWIGDEFSHVCYPICNSSCTNGFCSEPNRCACDDGYTLMDDGQTCEPFCREACRMGNCTAPDTCSCDEGYRLLEDSYFICEPHCSSSCDNGFCSEPNKCSCSDGYVASDDWQTCEPFCQQVCHMGTCTAPNTCTCHEGYEMKNGSSNHCVVICECQNGFCNDDNSTCVTCAEGYDLTVIEDNSTSCQPHCEGNCSSRGQCVEPQRCDCDEQYVADNDTLGNPVCLHACGGDCRHGSCDVGTGLCSCYYGWAGKFCEEALACVVKLYNDSKISWRPSEWDGYDESANWTVREEPWTGPTCHEQCLHAVDNSTKCLDKSDDSEGNVWLICYMSIESSCNTRSVVMANLFKPDVNVATIAAGCGVTLLLLATAFSATLIFKKKKQRRDAIAMTSSEQEQPEAEEDRLIENDNDGISL